jgi:hypothetical protein
VTNAGARPTDGTVTVTDALPPGLTVQYVSFFAPAIEDGGLDIGGIVCPASSLKCNYPAAIQPDETLRMIVYVSVGSQSVSGTPLANKVTVSGGGAPDASIVSENEVASSQPSFGVSNFDFYIDGLDGTRDTQAGGHPHEVTTTIDLNTSRRVNPEGTISVTSVSDVKDVVVDLPLGCRPSSATSTSCMGRTCFMCVWCRHRRVKNQRSGSPSSTPRSSQRHCPGRRSSSATATKPSPP